MLCISRLFSLIVCVVLKFCFVHLNVFRCDKEGLDQTRQKAVAHGLTLIRCRMCLIFCEMNQINNWNEYTVYSKRDDLFRLFCLIWFSHISFLNSFSLFCCIAFAFWSASLLLCVCVYVCASVPQVLKLLKLLYQWPGFNEHCDIWTFLSNDKVPSLHICYWKGSDGAWKRQGVVLIITLTCSPLLSPFNVVSLLLKCN